MPKQRPKTKPSVAKRVPPTPVFVVSTTEPEDIDDEDFNDRFENVRVFETLPEAEACAAGSAERSNVDFHVYELVKRNTFKAGW